MPCLATTCDPSTGGFFAEVITEQQITGFIQATFSEAQASHTKVPEATIYAFVITDLLPNALAWNIFGFTEQQITGFLQATFSEAQASHTKVPEATIYAFVITDLLPNALAWNIFGFSNIATDIVGKS